MRVVVIGATGNVGTSLVRALEDDPAVDSVVGLARRSPASDPEVAPVDITTDELNRWFLGADAVVHLAWAIQPSHDLNALWSVNVWGSRRVLRATAEAGVKTVIVASSVGAYSPGPKDRRVNEDWPTHGIPTSFYARHKAGVERMLDRFERELPEVRVVRLRPGLTFKRDAATEIRRLFLGPLVPKLLVRPSLLPVIPMPPELRLQGVHADDVANAYRLAVLGEARGAFNIAAEPVLDADVLSKTLGARPVRIPARAVHALAELTWRLHLQPTPSGWVDLALEVPLMDTSRAREELGWKPTIGADEALRELLVGMSEGAGAETPPLSPKTSGRFRVREVLTGIGQTRDS